MIPRLLVSLVNCPYVSLQGFLADKGSITLLADVRSLVQVNSVNVHGELETVGVSDVAHGAGKAKINKKR